jgi:hypothetical protein
MGLCCIIQSSHYPEVPIEDSPTNHQCPMVRNKSYVTQGSVYPTIRNCPTGTNWHSSHSTAVSPKPTDGTNPRSAKQQAIAMKMDTGCDYLRHRRWTSPRLPPTRINALAHRDNNKSILWLVILELKKNLMSFQSTWTVCDVLSLPIDTAVQIMFMEYSSSLWVLPTGFSFRFVWNFNKIIFLLF